MLTCVRVLFSGLIAACQLQVYDYCDMQMKIKFRTDHILSVKLCYLKIKCFHQ